MDMFTEYLVKRKKTNIDYLIYAGIVICALALFYLYLCFLPLLDYLLAVVVGLCYAAYWLMSKRNIEFEYTFTNGEIDVDRIVARRRRRRIITVEVKAFKFFEPAKSGTGDDYPGIQNTIHAEGDPDAENTYVAVLTHKGNLIRLYFQPSPRMLEYIGKYLRIRG